jgi:hypothetical protein
MNVQTEEGRVKRRMDERTDGGRAGEKVGGRTYRRRKDG